ncbi:hypothetical protein HPB48_000911 [Haemaphysalis longicornis]|uniref:Uncharacterized protein n=1 Tax=Haemaphysalis longicornis TaxID=44386 RepID=A0A9J6GZE7_HAELO|nr:hypothetical protein HPB48_000911 [Haemaphysalis longicornis]
MFCLQTFQPLEGYTASEDVAAATLLSPARGAKEDMALRPLEGSGRPAGYAASETVAASALLGFGGVGLQLEDMAVLLGFISTTSCIFRLPESPPGLPPAYLANKPPLLFADENEESQAEPDPPPSVADHFIVWQHRTTTSAAALYKPPSPGGKLGHATASNAIMKLPFLMQTLNQTLALPLHFESISEAIARVEKSQDAVLSELALIGATQSNMEGLVDRLSSRVDALEQINAARAADPTTENGNTLSNLSSNSKTLA